MPEDSENCPLTVYEAFSNSKRREVWAKTFNTKLREAYSGVGAIPGLVSTHSAGGHLASLGFWAMIISAGWNWIDTAGALLEAPDRFKSARESIEHKTAKTAIAWTNVIYFGLVLFAATTTAFVISACAAANNGFKNSFLESDETLGSSLAWALCDFAFGGGLFVSAAFSLFDLYEHPEQYWRHLILFLGNVTGGMGATFGGFSMLIKPKLFLMLSNIFFTSSAVIKNGVILHDYCCASSDQAEGDESRAILPRADSSPHFFNLVAAEERLIGMSGIPPDLADRKAHQQGYASV